MHILIDSILYKNNHNDDDDGGGGLLSGRLAQLNMLRYRIPAVRCRQANELEVFMWQHNLSNCSLVYRDTPLHRANGRGI